MKTKYIIIVLLASLCTSCENFFEPDNSSVVFDKDNYRNLNDVNASVLGLYRQMQDLAEPIILLGELRADLMSVSDAAPKELKEIDNLTYSRDNQYIDGRKFFTVINSCDEILTNMTKVLGRDIDFTQAVYNDFKAEVSGVKYWCYWQLALMHSSVTFNNQQMNTDQLAKALIVELEQIKNDFRITGYSPDWVRARMNNWAMAAFCAELYMYVGDFAAATLDLERVMDMEGAHQFKVTNTFEGDKWKNIFKDFTTAQQELIWGLDYSAVQKQKNELQKFANDYLVITDPCRAVFAGDTKRGQNVSYGLGKVAKYALYTSRDHENAIPVIIYRAADIHLRYAECLNHMEKHAQALEFINIGNKTKYIETKGVRGRVGLPKIENKIIIAATDSLYVVDSLILSERARELAFEGKRWYDLMRFNEYHPEKEVLKTIMTSKRSQLALKLEDNSYFYVKF